MELEAVVVGRCHARPVTNPHRLPRIHGSRTAASLPAPDGASEDSTATSGPAGGPRAGASILRLAVTNVPVGIALWVVATIAPGVVSRGPASAPEALLFLLLFAPFWLPGVLTCAVAAGFGAAFAVVIATRAAHRNRTAGRASKTPPRASPAWIIGAGAAGSAAAGSVVQIGGTTLVGFSGPPFVGVVVIAWMISGAFGTSVALRAAARRRPTSDAAAGDAASSAATGGSAGCWVLLAVALLTAATFAELMVGLRSAPFDSDDRCDGYVTRTLPTQTWCAGDDGMLVAQVPAWRGVMTIALLTAAALALLAAATGLLSDGRRRRVTGTVALATLGLGATWAVVAAAAFAPSGPAGRPASTPGDEIALPPTDQELHDAVVELRDRADREIGEDPLRPDPLVIGEAPCTTPDGALTGTAVTLTGTFSARDLATARDAGEFLSSTRLNEEIANRIVVGWQDSGLLSEAEPLHGEWYQASGPRAGGATERSSDGWFGEAHVGFVEGVGEIRVSTVCQVG